MMGRSREQAFREDGRCPLTSLRHVAQAGKVGDMPRDSTCNLRASTPARALPSTRPFDVSRALRALEDLNLVGCRPLPDGLVEAWETAWIAYTTHDQAWEVTAKAAF
jgi:hypothetical protein